MYPAHALPSLVAQEAKVRAPVDAAAGSAVASRTASAAAAATARVILADMAGPPSGLGRVSRLGPVKVQVAPPQRERPGQLSCVARRGLGAGGCVADWIGARVIWQEECCPCHGWPRGIFDHE